MEPGLGADVLDREFQTVLIAGDGLVLRTVVLEHAFDLIHAPDTGHVEDEDDDLEDAFKERMQVVGLQDIVGDIFVEHVDEERRQPHEEHQREGDAEDDRDDHQSVDDAFRQMGLHPLVELRGLFLIDGAVVFHRLLGGVVEVAVAELQGLEERDDAADKGPFGDRVPVLKTVFFMVFDFDLAVREADRGGRIVRASHHESLDEGLAADAGLMTFFTQLRLSPFLLRAPR